MGRRRFKPEQILHLFREAEIKLAGGKTTGPTSTRYFCGDLKLAGQDWWQAGDIEDRTPSKRVAHEKPQIAFVRAAEHS